MKNKLLIFLLFFFCSLFILNSNVFAKDTVKTPTSAELGISDASIKSTIENVSKWILKSIGVLAILMIIVGAVWYILSGGDQDGVEDATDLIVWAVVGLAVALLGYAIVLTIGNVLGAGTVRTPVPEIPNPPKEV